MKIREQNCTACDHTVKQSPSFVKSDVSYAVVNMELPFKLVIKTGVQNTAAVSTAGKKRSKEIELKVTRMDGKGCVERHRSTKASKCFYRVQFVKQN